MTTHPYDSESVPKTPSVDEPLTDDMSTASAASVAFESASTPTQPAPASPLIDQTPPEQTSLFGAPPAAAPASTAPLGQPAAPVHESGQHAAPTAPSTENPWSATTGQMSPQANPYAGQHAAPAAGMASPHVSHGAAPTAPGASAPATAPAKRSSGGKTFLFGFLGALVACALCLGGFALFNGANNAGGVSTTSTLGNTNSSVIEAGEDNATLAEMVAAKALPSVVAVYNYQEASSMGGFYGYGTNQGGGASDGLTASGMGSGVVISEDGYILTNYHVVQDAKVVRVTVDGEERDAKYIGGDSSSDVAVVQVTDTEGLVPVDLGNSDDLVIGEWVMTIGAPLGLEQSVATGVVSATNRSTIMDSSSDSGSYYNSNQAPSYTYYPNMIQTDAVINPGNSGGALVDADGKLIGINTMISSYSGDYAGVGFAIPVNYAMGIADDIIQGKTPTHAMLGVSISTVNAQTAKRYGFNAQTGAYINAITPGTGAADSDLQVGDIITAVDGKAVESATDVTLDVRAHAVGDTVKVTVNRNGQTQDVDVVLSSDENLLSNGTPQSQDGSSSDSQSSPYGGNGGSNGQNMRNLEELLRMFGM